MNEQAHSVQQTWQRSGREVIDNAAMKVNDIFDSLKNAEVPTIMWDFMGDETVDFEVQKCGTILLLVSDDDTIFSFLAKALSRSGILVRRVSIDDFLSFDMDERSLQAIERDVWRGKARDMITVVTADNLSETDVLEKRRDWLSFVENLHKHSPILRSYGGRGDVRQGLAFLDWDRMALKSDASILEGESSSLSAVWDQVRGAWLATTRFLGVPAGARALRAGVSGDVHGE